MMGELLAKLAGVGFLVVIVWAIHIGFWMLVVASIVWVLKSMGVLS